MDTIHKQAEPSLSGATDFPAMLRALACPEAFPFAIPDTHAISVLQTHASAVILTPDRVYKLKKPTDLGFLNYSTPTLRRQYCLQEVQLNSPLAPGVYLGVAPILLGQRNAYWFGPTISLRNEALPPPGVAYAGGLVVDYAVVMVRLPEETTLESRVRAGTATPSLLKEVARMLAAFHTAAETSEQIAQFGNISVIQANWDETMAQIQPYVGRTLTTATYQRIVAYGHAFLTARAPLFASRVAEHHIRDGHGDLRLQHVYFLEHALAGGPEHAQLLLLDRIEFNERFRYGDVTSEVAFLAMELEAACRADLARVFVEAYLAETRDETLRELLPFYLCYRACVRGKVSSFELEEAEIPERQRHLAAQRASELFALAEHYASGPTGPLVVMVGGLMGTGKSVLAQALHRETGWVYASSDVVRKHLVRCDPAQPQPEAFGQGIYNPEWTGKTYNALALQARDALACGRSILLDATFGQRHNRQRIEHSATEQHAAALFVECQAPRSTTLRRLEERWSRRSSRGQSSSDDASAASDGRSDLYDAQKALWELFRVEAEAPIGHLVVTTTALPEVIIEQVCERVGVSRLACWLTRFMGDSHHLGFMSHLTSTLLPAPRHDPPAEPIGDEEDRAPGQEE